ncbi:hypothetical protein LC087_04350 [Bacillus carboniphilus]|uniref:Uncharacterized protein n=1 Tax=Bacillus carboniphilus TaxID=86663 RepID=A0ABY9JYI8_9BACI|nr:hypothetical protein [Bacillus carboniphilus]WLR43413.1 hypothetical protein LC087_04350 [Bacillus carboniphilus]
MSKRKPYLKCPRQLFLLIEPFTFKGVYYIMIGFWLLMLHACTVK